MSRLFFKVTSSLPCLALLWYLKHSSKPGISEGTLRAHYASQKPPATNEGPVLTVVGDTFEELVLNNDKSVIVEFYAPCTNCILLVELNSHFHFSRCAHAIGCGHCKQLAPTWEKLGEHYRGSDNLIVAQIDASANDNPAVVVQVSLLSNVQSELSSHKVRMPGLSLHILLPGRRQSSPRRIQGTHEKLPGLHCVH